MSVFVLKFFANFYPNLFKDETMKTIQIYLAYHFLSHLFRRLLCEFVSISLQDVRIYKHVSHFLIGRVDFSFTNFRSQGKRFPQVISSTHNPYHLHRYISGFYSTHLFRKKNVNLFSFNYLTCLLILTVYKQHFIWPSSIQERG